MEFKTFSYRSGFVGLIIATGLAAGAAALGSILIAQGELSLRRPLSPLALGMSVAILLDLLVLTLFIYWSLAVLRLRYRLDRNGLVIQWGASRLVVPIERIQSIKLGSEMDESSTGEPAWRAFRGVGWAGLRAGHARFADDKPVRVFITGPLARSTVILTQDSAYIVSPRDPDAFIEAWQVRRPLGPTQHWREEERRAPLLNLSIWRDRLAWILIGFGLLANLSLHIYMTLVFQQLPDMLSFHFNVLGQVDRIANRTAILRFPQVAFLMLALDLGLGFLLYRRQRVAAYLIFLGGAILQLLVWGAVLTITG